MPRRGMMWKMTCVASLVLLTGCATDGIATSGCEWTRPILVGDADVLTDETARQILAHNETGARICGWP